MLLPVFHSVVFPVTVPRSHLGREGMFVIFTVGMQIDVKFCMGLKVVYINTELFHCLEKF